MNCTCAKIEIKKNCPIGQETKSQYGSKEMTC